MLSSYAILLPSYSPIGRKVVHNTQIDIADFGSLRMTAKTVRGDREVLGEIHFRLKLISDDAQSVVLSTIQGFNRVNFVSCRDGWLVVKANIEDIDENKRPGFLSHIVDDLLIAIERAASSPKSTSKTSKSKVKSKKQQYVNRRMTV